MTSAPVSELDRSVHRQRQRTAGIVGDSDGQRAALTGQPHGGQRVGGGAAGGQGDHHVLRRDLGGQQIALGQLLVVLGAFHRSEHRPLSAGDQRHQALRGQVKVGSNSTPSSTPSRPEVPAPR